MLDEEIRFYEENLPDWLQRHEARVVLVKGRELIGFFDTEGDAIEEGARLFGFTSILVCRVLPTQPFVSVPVIAHGVLAIESDLGRTIRQRLIDQLQHQAEPSVPAC
ncbi:MAG TPA: hypothetical protein VH482_12605 [Thermomicrobiales bacterium]|jgi:hypothetical protein